ncbi:MAG: bifunctional diaminohydroxyphosphoribosylaminopyrimidine deaminase/5-amino-6-(5-phosphoribosylamino)uracil reductase RibD [Verrucomicrobia bacterium]|nr:MAG: bifunctional diaminohydroxyphosphoribosylaminopyrimidine deaminase/5-amino-6-(5-phosphoribosylamino)uracil reductase RibD [Verrucomicrobiota bacterium]
MFWNRLTKVAENGFAKHKSFAAKTSAERKSRDCPQRRQSLRSCSGNRYSHSRWLRSRTSVSCARLCTKQRKLSAGRAQIRLLARCSSGAIASSQRGRVPPDATLYVTLEPCSTHGRTGACTSELIKAGVRTVVIGALDVNPRHRGRAVPQLQAAGVEVRTGILGEDCRRLNEAFNKWIVTRRPFVIAKCGMSLDGRLSRREGEPRWITDSVARRHSHQLRAQVDAILVGAETLRADNPQLTVRGVSGARQPWRVVVTRSGKLPKTAR